MSYTDYKNARDMAWKVLLDSNIDTLPVDVRAICKKLNCRLYSYDAGEKIIRAFKLQNQTALSDGFTVLYRGTPYIFYSSETSESRQRFTIAHEIGHIVLGHLEKEKYTIKSREHDSEESIEETQANQFAARILAPACVLHAMGAVSADQISLLCGISKQAAEIRAKRMEELQRRGKFLSHPLEREVMRRFEPFVRSRLEGNP